MAQVLRGNLLSLGCCLLLAITLMGCPPPKRTVPNVVGNTQAAATSAILAAKLTVGTITQQSSSTIAAGRVISQNPAAGATANNGSAVALVISSGPQIMNVPNVVGFTQADAEAAILAAGLTVGTITQQSSFTIAAGSVISQNPAANATANNGSAVSLVISSGPQIMNVPTVVGLTQAAAEAAIVAAGLTVGPITFQINNTVAEGQVISQDPIAGTGLPAGFSVSLIVSLGPDAVIVPILVGISRTAAETAILNAGLTVGVVTEQFSDTLFGVLTQDPPAGTPVPLGTAINLHVSLGPQCTQSQVPDLSAETRLTAPGLLSVVGLTVGTISEAFDATTPREKIVSADPAVGTCLAPGTAVNLVVSIGPEPILIHDVVELQKIGNDAAFPINGNYALANDIDASVAKAGGLFTPIGSAATPFTGLFYGNNFTISGLQINQPTEDNVGLFAAAGVADSPSQAALIQDLNISGGSVTGHDQVGALCGAIVNGSVINCHADIAVTGEQSIGGLFGIAGSQALLDSCTSAGAVVSVTLGDIANQADAVGGLIGVNFGELSNCTASGAVDGGPHGTATGGLVGSNGGNVSNCSASGNVTSTTLWVGGLIGWNALMIGQTISDCMSSGDVHGFSHIGGLIGNNINSTVLNSHATGNVTALGIAGGLIGQNSDSDISKCYATGNVALSSTIPGSAYDWAGGLIGINDASDESLSTITQCYALGDVSGRTEIGGLVGKDSNLSGNVAGPIIECYAAGAVSSLGENGGLVGKVAFGTTPVTNSFWDVDTTGIATSNGGGTSLTTAQMMTSSNFSAASWDFVNVWDILEGTSYPFLR